MSLTFGSGFRPVAAEVGLAPLSGAPFSATVPLRSGPLQVLTAR